MIAIPNRVTRAHCEDLIARLAEVTGHDMTLFFNNYGNMAAHDDHLGKQLTPGYLTNRQFAHWISGVFLHLDIPEVFNAKQES